MAKTPTSKGKPVQKKAAATAGLSKAVKFDSLPDENRIRERAYGIWVEEGRPHGQDLAHWQRAWRELQPDAR